MLLFSIIAREFRSAARKKRVHVLRLLFGGAMAVWFFVVVFHWLRVEAIGEVVYQSLMQVFAQSSILLALLLAAPSIAVERNDDTLGLLFHTKLSPHHIVLAKFSARLAEMLWFILLAFPFFALPVWMGGVDRDCVVGDSLIVFALIVFATATGVCVSAFFRNATGAFLVSAALLFALDQSLKIPPSSNSMGVFLGSTEHFDLPYLIGYGLCNIHRLIPDPDGSLFRSETACALADLPLAATGALVMLGIASWKLRRLSRSSSGDGSIMWKRKIRAWNRVGNWMAALTCLVLVVLAEMRLLSRPNSFGEFFLMWGGYLDAFGKLLAIMLVAQSVASEKEARTLESFVCTPLSNGSLVNRKMVETWRACWGWYLLFHAFVIALLLDTLIHGAFTQGALLKTLSLGFVFELAVIFSFGCFCSAYAKTTVRAILLTILAICASSLLFNVPSMHFLTLAPTFRWRAIWIFASQSTTWMIVSFLVAVCVYLILIRNFRRFAARQ
ncbi:MAG: hypothetical protein EXS18_07325 [Verrucomicrobiae bacterium]|nr:hypothetical protein [Verrucomicrobiae bacterium]